VIDLDTADLDTADLATDDAGRGASCRSGGVVREGADVDAAVAAVLDRWAASTCSSTTWGTSSSRAVVRRHHRGGVAGAHQPRTGLPGHHAVLPTMIPQRRGSIINLSNVEELSRHPQHPVYAACKAGVTQFGKAGPRPRSARDQVNDIAPDVTRSQQRQCERWLDDDDRAHPHVGAARAAGRAPGPGRSRAVPRLGSRRVRHGHHDPLRRGHVGRRGLVPLRPRRAGLDQPTARPLTAGGGPTDDADELAGCARLANHLPD
jgi:NAD(P)-dependent dehydrogenase (short-subunit alcohol dehydrogenase family)